MCLLLVLIGSFFFIRHKKGDRKKDTWQTLRGYTMGTTFRIVCYPKLFQTSQIDSLLKELNQIFSTYDPNSEISKLNKTDSFPLRNPHLSTVLHACQDIYLQSQGAFDPSLGGLIEAWGFGSSKPKTTPSNRVIDSLKQYVGWDKIQILPQLLIKSPETYLNLNAIAKGYAVDVIAQFLEDKNTIHYMVEIGGEIRSKGRNPRKKAWKIGISNPLYPDSDEPLQFLFLKKGGLATSGNYRNFYLHNNKIYAHTLSAQNGKPISSSLLSVSIQAPSAMYADAIATACMVMGLKKGKAWVQQQNVQALFVFLDENEELRTWQSP
ncbi:MAG: FAD:protein FMN transferase [Cytophagales bacterium]|nr:FAD:protein FMN transferase [Cytophagales bacterium]